MTTTATRPVSVDELRRAYVAMTAGDFRPGRPRPAPSDRWAQHGTVVPVVGACPGSGASTLVLALATAAGTARIVECAAAETAGLVAATTAELGRDRQGWMRGCRDQILIERPARSVHCPGDVPAPAVTDAHLVVVDVAWGVEFVLDSAGWLGDLLRRPAPVVVTAVLTVPGLRRLDAALHRLNQPVVAVKTPARTRLPRTLVRALDDLRHTHQLADRIVPVPLDPRLRTQGPDSSQLPNCVVHAAAQVLQIALDGKDTP